MLEIFKIAGSLFVILSFIHFFADWIFQTHKEATNKHNNALVRARHCTVYTISFVPVILLLGVNGWPLFISIATLFLSHFVIDTYLPVFLWAQYIRKIPALCKNNSIDNRLELPIDVNPKDKQAVFKWLWSQPVYPILFIAVDQICHLTFLWVVVAMILL